MMVPARLAIALQDDGWFIRSDIIWAKKNPMPESVTDRPTSAHEHIFLLTRNARYFYDAEAVREGNSNPLLTECAIDWRDRPNNGVWPSGTGGRMGSVSNGRNLRNVWHLATEATPLFHFATYPTEIPRKCIKAGTSEKGCCAACGAPWVRVVKPTEAYAAKLAHANDRGDWYDRVTTTGPRSDGTKQGKQEGGIRAEYETTGWQPGCTCDAETKPCVVLDPFLGSGTTLLVADQLRRDGIGIELNVEYAAMAEDRIRGSAPMFTDVALSATATGR